TVDHGGRVRPPARLSLQPAPFRITGQERVRMADCPGIHVRFNGGVLARLERRVLEWIARRLPDSISPDHLSAIGLAAMAGTATAFAAFRWNDGAAAAAVVATLAANWFGDSLDGTVARVRRIERPRYGYYVDHVIDLAGTSLL